MQRQNRNILLLLDNAPTHTVNESTNPKLSGRVDLNTPIRNADQVESVCNPKWLRRFCFFWRIDARPEKSRVSPFESRKNRNRFGLEVITHPGLEKRESK